VRTDYQTCADGRRHRFNGNIVPSESSGAGTGKEAWTRTTPCRRFDRVSFDMREPAQSLPLPRTQAGIEARSAQKRLPRTSAQQESNTGPATQCTKQRDGSSMPLRSSRGYGWLHRYPHGFQVSGSASDAPIRTDRKSTLAVSSRGCAVQTRRRQRSGSKLQKDTNAHLQATG